jgi:DNA-directed RNA polymerase specialized sigma24 family protein
VTDTVTWENVSALMSELRSMAHMLLSREDNAQSVALGRQRPDGKPWQEVTWKDRSYFFGAMYQAMRRALIDYGKARHAGKRDRRRRVSIDDVHMQHFATTGKEHPEIVDALLIALERLREQQPEWAEIVEHRYFSDLAVKDIAHVMDRSEKTIQRHWNSARALLHDEILRILNDENGRPSL